MKSRRLILLFPLTIFASTAAAEEISIQWGKVKQISQTIATLQVVVNPLLRRGSSIHDRVYSELQRLGADYVRYVPWLPYPRLAVAELKPPTKHRAYWDFSLIDPMTLDFMNAIKGHPVILNFSTIPAWMFKTPKPVNYPGKPDEPNWAYTQGTELRDPSGKELGDYFARLVGWYVRGGFTDELGKWHKSGHHFKIDYWEVLNEPDVEHNTTPEQYTARYDAITTAIRQVAPKIKFVGIAMAQPANDPQMFEYFLNPGNHKPGIPLDMISYHFYAVPTADQSIDTYQFTFFEQADRFIATARYVESIRRRLSPLTQTTVNEVGSILPDDSNGNATIPDAYWNLSGACFAYVFGHLTELGVNIVGESQLVGYPTQFPSVSMVDWGTGLPNARFRVLELLKDNFGLGVKIVTTLSGSPYVYALGTIKPKGKHLLLLVNKRDRDIELKLPGRANEVVYVDQATKGDTPGRQPLDGDKFILRGFAVAVVTMAAD